MPDFWPSSGFHLLARDAAGHLTVTDEYLRAYLLRPEVRPTDDSCAAERALHAALFADPRQAVAPERLARLADPDARDNYRVLLDFFARLLQAGTVEGCYLGLFRESRVAVPPLFVDQMAHVVVRNILDGADDPLRARAGELLFREQTATVKDGAVLMGDSETVEMYATTRGMGDLGRLIVEGGAPMRQIELDVLQAETAALYWGRNERFDTVLDLSFARPGLDALCRVLEAWVAHFLGARVRIQPVQKIADERWVWHVGLDAESSAILNDLYNGAEVGEDRLERLLALFRLEFEDSRQMRAAIAGRPVYLGLAMSAGKKVRVKPQNLLVNLPLAAGA
jgi:hypothetical protein